MNDMTLKRLMKSYFISCVLSVSWRRGTLTLRSNCFISSLINEYPSHLFIFTATFRLFRGDNQGYKELNLVQVSLTKAPFYHSIEPYIIQFNHKDKKVF